MAEGWLSYSVYITSIGTRITWVVHDVSCPVITCGVDNSRLWGYNCSLNQTSPQCAIKINNTLRRRKDDYNVSFEIP